MLVIHDYSHVGYDWDNSELLHAIKVAQQQVGWLLLMCAQGSGTPLLQHSKTVDKLDEIAFKVAKNVY